MSNFSHPKIRTTEKHERIEIVPRSNPIHGKFPTETFGKNRQTSEITKEKRDMEMGNRTRGRFWKIKQTLTEGPCLAHYAKDKEILVTTDTTGITLWQKQDDGNIIPIAYGSRYLNDTEKKYSIGELELLAVVWGLEKFRFYLNEKRVHHYTDHQALEPLKKPK